MLLHLARHGELEELLELLAEEREDIEWPTLPADFDLGGSDDDLPSGSKAGSQINIGDVGSNAAFAVGDGASVSVQNTNVQNYDFSGTIAGDVNIAGDVHLDAADLPIPAPPPTTLPPSLDRFVGRVAELAKYQAQLDGAQIAVISGMAGMGKSLLAAAVAERAAPSEKIFWHTFRPGEGIETVVWQLAAFLAHRDQDDLWQTLQRARLTRGAPPPPETVINYLVELVRGRGYLLVLDDIHHINDDPQLGVFIERTRRAVVAGDFRIILTSRELPEFVTLVETAFIDGLSPAAVEEMLKDNRILLPAELVERLHARTQGNPELITLSIELLRDNPRPEQLIDNLDEARSVEKYILQEIDGQLEEDEPQVMTAVSVLDYLGYRGTRYAIGAVLDGQNVRRVVRDLADRFLLLSQQTEGGSEYGQHAMVRDFYYDGLNRRQRQALHQLAGIYYRDEETRPLRAAEHLLRAGQGEQAAELVTGDVWQFINQGQSRALLDLLNRLQEQTLPATVERQVRLALGEVSAFLGETEAARMAFTAVLDEVQNNPAAAVAPQDLVRAYFGLGDVLAQNEPAEALAWLAKGIAIVEENTAVDSQAAVGVYLKTGTIFMWQGDFAQAAHFLEIARDRLPEGPSQMRSRVLSTLGAVVFEHERDADRAMALTEEALDSCRTLHDWFNLSTILSNRGGERFNIDDWAGAVEDFRESLRLAEQIGSERARAIGSMNLGTTLICLGDDEEAFQLLAVATELADATDQLYLKNMVLLARIDLHVRRQEWDAAAELLEHAQPLTDRLEDEYSRPAIARGWAQVELGRGRSAAAAEHAEEAVTLSRQLEDPGELGISLQILGRVFWGEKNLAASQAAFAESARLLADHDSYEAAQTSLWWGMSLIEGGQKEAGEQLVQQAHAVLKKLGAKRELALHRDFSRRPF